MEYGSKGSSLTGGVWSRYTSFGLVHPHDTSLKWGISWGKANFLSTAIVERISPITYPLFKLRTSEKEWAFLISFSASAGGINC